MAKKTLHVIPHSHWDREWYMSFEQHRMRLVELFDTLIDTMEKHPEYKYYHMDGQYVVIEDYLEVRPGMRDRLMKLIHDNRIQIGPWYVLQDEYLTGGESNIRNMLYGIRLCREIGAEPVMSGYFPDAFGNVSQAPQILQGFGIDNAVFGRGVGSVLEDNKVDPNGSDVPSEIIWRAPDGSEVIGVMFVMWYHNAMELPSDPDALKKRIDGLVAGLSASAATPELLGMNGCDHQPVQTNLADVLKTARSLYDPAELDVQQSNFKDYIEKIRPYREKFPLIEGEINGQRTNGANPLIDTASTHVPIKQLNHRGQNALDRIAEPLSVIAFLTGKDSYRSDQLLFAWKQLMQNHPHDSICTCSCDDVAREMVTRFEKSYQSASFIRDEALDAVMRNINSAPVGDMTVTVFHTEPGRTTGTVKVNVDYPLDSGIETLSVFTAAGEEVPCSVTKLGRTFTYTLPKDSFRKPRYVDRFEVEMLVTAEGIGYSTYALRPVAPGVKKLVRLTARGADNGTIAFKIESNGSLTVTDRVTGVTYSGNNIFEDLGDAGETYNFRSAANDRPITTENDEARVSVERETPYSVTYRVVNTMRLPSGLKDGKRSGHRLNHEIVSLVTLTAGVHRVDIETIFDNRAENHRLRALFLPEIKTEKVFAEGQFDIVERDILPYKTWKNPCNCQRMQAFFGIEDARHGLIIATRGLNEYEILRDGRNTMALTLLRCVNHLGDWGVFPTPDAQCKGVHHLRYSVVPFAAKNRADSVAEAFTFYGEPFTARAGAAQSGELPADFLTVKAEGKMLPFSAFKKAEHSDSAIIRFYNADVVPQKLALTFGRPVAGVWMVNLAEERQQELKLSGRSVVAEVPAKKIVTFEIKF